MKLIVFLYMGVVGVMILAMGARYIHAKAAEARLKVERRKIRTRLHQTGRTAEELSRIHPIIGANLLKQRRIALYGAGSIGSWLAYYVAPLAGKLRVIDSDTVDASNIAGGRTIYTKTHLGMAKPLALKQILEHDFPDLSVQAYHEDINRISDSFLKEILDADIIICAVDDIQCILRLNELFYGRRPIVYGGFMRQAAEGFVCIVTENTPCFQCCMRLKAQSFETLHRSPD